MSDIEQQVDHLIDTRPGKELLQPNYEDVAYEVAPNIFRSNGATADFQRRDNGHGPKDASRINCR